MSLALRCRRFVVPVIAAVAASGFISVSAARAGVLVESAGDCEGQTLSRPFTPWLDPARYTPLGGFEDAAAGWTLDRASVVTGNEPWGVAEDDGAHSLRVRSGGAATSPSMCVGLEHPTVRFFAKREGGSLLSTLRVDVLYENHLGLLETLPVGLVGSGGSWQPTAAFAVIANLLPLLPGEHTAVAFRFTPQGSADWRIDDVFVDPWRGG